MSPPYCSQMEAMPWHMHTHTGMHTYTHASMHSHCMHTHTHAHARTHAHTHASTHIRMHTCNHACMHARTQARTHTCMYVHSHVHIPSMHTHHKDLICWSSQATRRVWRSISDKRAPVNGGRLQPAHVTLHTSYFTFNQTGPWEGPFKSRRKWIGWPLFRGKDCWEHG